MRRHREELDPNSCWNRAKDGELVFVLLGRDHAAPSAIRFWVAERIRLGLNTPDDEQTGPAMDLADEMEAEQLK